MDETDPAYVIKIKELLKDIRSTPFKGIGKPEPLRHDLKGYWSRRINHEHRLVYKVSGKKGDDQQCLILQCDFFIKIRGILWSHTDNIPTAHIKTFIDN